MVQRRRSRGWSLTWRVPKPVTLPVQVLRLTEDSPRNIETLGAPNQALENSFQAQFSAIDCSYAFSSARQPGNHRGENLLSKIATVFSAAFGTARSGAPFRSKSPTATACGFEPVVKLTGLEKLPSPPPNKMLTVVPPPLRPEFAVARSRLPSPLKSAAETRHGASVTAKLTADWKLPSPLPKSTLRSVSNELATARS